MDTIFDQVEGFLINQGETNISQDFFYYDTHVQMCYELTDCQLLEPENTTNDNLGGILICQEWRD